MYVHRDCMLAVLWCLHMMFVYVFAKYEQVQLLLHWGNMLKSASVPAFHKTYLLLNEVA